MCIRDRVELTRPIWEQGLEVPEVDLKAALSSLNMGESSSHAELGKKILARSKEGRYLRPRTIRQKLKTKKTIVVKLKSRAMKLKASELINFYSLFNN